MPVVIKRDEPGKNPKGKDPKAAAAKSGGAAGKAPAPAKPAAKSSTKPAAAGAKGKKKGAKDAPNETSKLVALGVVTVLALGFLVWYMFFRDIGGTPTTVEPTPAPMSAPSVTGGTGQPGGTGQQLPNRRSGGLSTGEAAPGSNARGFGRSTESTGGNPEGIE